MLTLAVRPRAKCRSDDPRAFLVFEKVRRPQTLVMNSLPTVTGRRNGANEISCDNRDVGGLFGQTTDA
jgi:hypothetical protein